MVAELGNFALILALLVALYQSAFPLLGAVKGDKALTGASRLAAGLQASFILFAFLCLMYLHATSDFSVLNVVENSHTAKPFVYKLTGVWGNHEGSMLLWVLILAAFGLAVALTRASQITAMALSAQGIVASAFLAFVLFTSNPFARILPAPADGQDLNPLLQDPGLIIHPPFLYLGYVGFSVTFAFAVAGLIRGKIDAEWARTVRPFALAAWVFLTIGIALGSWWAYYELGWGGFWAWDPVENASFMPWLAGTAFLHSVRVVEKRGTLKVWTVLLAILAFSLSLIGTFLVRSGILTSVHAFAVDPARGVFILAILGLAIGGSLTLFALRAPKLAAEGGFQPVSREGALVVNNIFLVVATATVFVGTFYPLFIDVLSGERISVGAPYFNIIFAIISTPFLFIMAPGAMLAWKKGNISAAMKQALPAAGGALVILVIALWMTWPKHAVAAFAAALAVWAAGGALLDFAGRVKLFSGEFKSSLSRMAGLPRPYIGMTVSHLALGIVVIGVLGAGVWRTETVRLMNIGDVIKAGAYEATLVDIETLTGPNYVAETARFSIAKNGKALRDMTAERRFYPVRQMQTTEAAIWTTVRGDLYLTLGERRTDGGWAVRAYYNPFVFWLWFGAGLLALGGVIAALPEPKRRREEAPSPVMAEAV